MNKLARTFLYIGVTGTLFGVLLLLVHFKQPGIGVLLPSLIFLMAFAVTTMFSPNRRSSIVFPNDRNLRNLHKAALLVLYTGVLITVAGSFVKLLRYPGFKGFAIAGICVTTTGLFMLFYLSYMARKKMNQSPSAFLPESELDKYAGKYYCAQLKMDIRVFTQDGYLKAQATGQSAFALSPVKEEVFNCLSAGIVMEFHPTENEFILIQHGGYYPFVKKVA
jgi:hypothetical protein